MLLLLNTHSVAQLLPPMQANTPEEYDGYLQVLAAATPEARVQSAQRFQEQWPHSELLTHTYYLEAEAQKSLGRAAAAQHAAEEALRTAKDNIPALVLLAEILSNQSGAKVPLAVAESSARRALRLLETFRAPRSVSLDQLQSASNALVSRSHAVLGLVAFKRGETSTAIREFEIAEARMPHPDAALLYRLGKLYQEGGNRAGAIAKFQQVVLLDELTLRGLAKRELLALGVP